ncbi:hypothetical protein GCM10018782_13550 [Streptomyces griseoaurantiacus]|nr:hypothetical protein GCM10018782_13550 [Streptomyces griseoaurantiacus]
MSGKREEGAGGGGVSLPTRRGCTPERGVPGGAGAAGPEAPGGPDVVEVPADPDVPEVPDVLDVPPVPGVWRCGWRPGPGSPGPGPGPGTYGRAGPWGRPGGFSPPLPRPLPSSGGSAPGVCSGGRPAARAGSAPCARGEVRGPAGRVPAGGTRGRGGTGARSASVLMGPLPCSISGPSPSPRVTLRAEPARTGTTLGCQGLWPGTSPTLR